MMRSRDEIKKAIEVAIRKEFPTDTVDISDGYGSNIHVMVVSRRFDSMDDAIQRDLLWTLIRSAGLDDQEEALISLALTISPSIIK